MKLTLVRSVVVAGTLALGAGVAAPVANASTASDHTYGTTTVAVAYPVNRLIKSAGITAAPTLPATAMADNGTVAVSFPITGFSRDKMRIKHQGGLTLSKGATSITLKRFYIDADTGKVRALASGSAIGDAGRVVAFTASASQSKLGPYRLQLTWTAAHALNVTFGGYIFKRGETFGFATIALN